LYDTQKERLVYPNLHQTSVQIEKTIKAIK